MSMQVMDRAQWDEEHEVWMLQQLPKKVTKRPISTAQHRRPVTAYAQAAVALGDHNPRYKTDNILALALDMPDRTTADYSGSQMQTQVCKDSTAVCRGVTMVGDQVVQNACTLSCSLVQLTDKDIQCLQAVGATLSRTVAAGFGSRWQLLTEHLKRVNDTCRAIHSGVLKL